MNHDIFTTLHTFFSSFPIQQFKKGDILIEAGKHPRGIFFVTKGFIRQYYLSHEGSEITLNLFKPHAFLPMSWGIADIPNTYFFEAMSPVEAYCAPKEAVLTFLQKEPEVLYDLLRRVYIGIDGLFTHIEALTIGNSSAKLIALCVMLAKRFGISNADGHLTIAFPLTEYDIAVYAGMSRETVSRELQKLKKDTFISFEKGILTIYHLESLESLIAG